MDFTLKDDRQDEGCRIFFYLPPYISSTTILQSSQMLLNRCIGLTTTEYSKYFLDISHFK